MKKVILSLPILISLVMSADHVRVENCVEDFQRELTEILYAKPADKNISIEILTKKNNASEKECDLDIAQIDNNTTKNKSLQEEQKTSEDHVFILDTGKGNDDCIENFQNEIRDILNNDEQQGKEKRVKIIIKGDGSNCTKEQISK